MLFAEERFGMFVHFGLYAQNGYHEQEQWRLRRSKAEYTPLAGTFCPAQGCAEEWAALAREAGMQYLCFTVKHHDGFCLWDTAQTDYKVTNTPYGRDLLAEVAQACRRNGLLLELYYSQPDWYCPLSPNHGGDHQLPAPNPGDTPDEETYKHYIRAQMRELLTGYGEIAALFWDIPPKGHDPSINAYVRSLQPGILINDRGYDKGDYSTPERQVPKGAFSRYTEACQSVGAESWGYRRDEDYFTPAHLADSLDSILARGGNYLLNVGPDGKGHIPPRAQDTVRRVGRFFRRAKESYAGCRTVPGELLLTQRGRALYVHLPTNYNKSGFSLPVTVLPERVRVLGGRCTVQAELTRLPSAFRPEKPEIPLCLHVYDLPEHPMPLVVKLEFADMEGVLAALAEAAPDTDRIL